MDVLEEKYQFFCINMRVPMPQRYRKGLGEVINIDKYNGTTIKNKSLDVEVDEETP